MTIIQTTPSLVITIIAIALCEMVLCKLVQGESAPKITTERAHFNSSNDHINNNSYSRSMLVNMTQRETIEKIYSDFGRDIPPEHECSWKEIGCEDKNIISLNFQAVCIGGVCTEPINGTIPIEIGSLSNLILLDLSGNHQLSGTIPPSLGNLSELNKLDISYIDGLGGSIPTEIGNLSKLKWLDLCCNRQLAGPMPTQFGQLISLETMNVYLNNLTTTIPTEIGNLSKLKRLQMGVHGYPNSDQVMGSIPTEIGKLSILTDIDLGGNRMTGIIPTEIGNMSSLTSLAIGGNMLTGPIPTEIGNLPSIWKVDFSDNELTGTIPTEMSNLLNLRILDLDNNELTGTVPTELLGIPNLDLFGNNILFISPQRDMIENIYRHFGLSVHESKHECDWKEIDCNWNRTITSLVIENIQVTGSIPTEIGKLTSLEHLELRNTGVTGPIPTEIGKLTSLEYLELADNELTGTLPTQLEALISLRHLSIRQNTNLKGNIAVFCRKDCEKGFWLGFDDTRLTCGPQATLICFLRPSTINGIFLSNIYFVYVVVGVLLFFMPYMFPIILPISALMTGTISLLYVTTWTFTSIPMVLMFLFQELIVQDDNYPCARTCCRYFNGEWACPSGEL